MVSNPTLRSNVACFFVALAAACCGLSCASHPPAPVVVPPPRGLQQIDYERPFAPSVLRITVSPDGVLDYSYGEVRARGQLSVGQQFELAGLMREWAKNNTGLPTDTAHDPEYVRITYGGTTVVARSDGRGATPDFQRARFTLETYALQIRAGTKIASEAPATAP